MMLVRRFVCRKHICLWCVPKAACAHVSACVELVVSFCWGAVSEDQLCCRLFLRCRFKMYVREQAGFCASPVITRQRRNLCVGAGTLCVFVMLGNSSSRL